MNNSSRGQVKFVLWRLICMQSEGEPELITVIVELGTHSYYISPHRSSDPGSYVTQNTEPRPDLSSQPPHLLMNTHYVEL